MTHDTTPEAPAALVRMEAPCRVEGAYLFRGRLRLLPTWLLITGWTPHGPYRRRVVLSRIERIETMPTRRSQGRLILHLREREPLVLRLDGAGLWKLAIEAQLPSRRALSVRALFGRRSYVHQALYCAPPAGAAVAVSEGDGVAVSPPGRPVLRMTGTSPADRPPSR